jgi:hypothetical protein
MGVQPNDFRYTLTISGVSYILPQSPIGWDDSVLKWVRSNMYSGLIRTFTLPLKFPLDGAWLLRQEFYQNGIEGSAGLLIEKLTRATWQYKTIYNGSIDLSRFKDGLHDVEANVMEGGVTQQIKAYEGVKYEFDIDVPEAIEIELPGLKLVESATFLIEPTVAPNKPMFPGLEITSNELEGSVASAQGVVFERVVTPNYSTSDKWFFHATTATDVTIKGSIKGRFFVPLGNPNTFRLLAVKSDGSEIELFRYQTISAPIQEYNASFDETVSLIAGQKLFLYFFAALPNNTSSIEIDEGDFEINYETISPPSFCKALRPKYVFQKLIERMNTSAFPIQSFLLDQWDQLCITSGDAITRKPNPKLKTSFKDFFTSMNAVLNAGFGIENGKACLESKSYFFRPTLTAANVGNVKDFELEPYESYLASSIKVGYPDESYDKVNGRYEANSTQIYQTPITRVQQELNLLSVYRADPYGIEFLRIANTDKDTTDSDADNDTFFIKVKALPETGQTYYRPEGVEAFTSVTGTAAEDTIYNLDISPKRNLLRHGDYLHGMLDKLDGKYINFASGEKNTELKTVKNGVAVIEKANISISSLPDKLFLPYMVAITAKLPRNAMELIDLIPFGCIKFTYRENEYTGFLMEVSVDVSNNNQQELKLLLSPDNNLLNLIN